MASKAIAIDAMSGDFGPRVIVPATLAYLEKHPDCSAVLVGDQAQIHSLLGGSRFDRLTTVHAAEVIAMDEKPSVALRSKKQSSMRVALEMVQRGDAAACLSAGNTGALMAIGMHLLKMVEGVARPAICGAVPSLTGHSYLLDMGANVDCEAEHLLQFALMAQVLVQAVENKAAPTVTLLNNGEEEIKGNSQVKRAAELLTEHPAVNYRGYIEGHKIYQGAADIIVCDGFVGNIALKASEGVASYILERIRREIKADPISRFLAWFALPEFRRIKSKIDPRRFNGASLLGLNGVVVKSHGHADEEAFQHALHHTQQMLQVDIVQQLQAQFQ